MKEKENTYRENHELLGAKVLGRISYDIVGRVQERQALLWTGCCQEAGLGLQVSSFSSSQKEQKQQSLLTLGRKGRYLLTLWFG